MPVRVLLAEDDDGVAEAVVETLTLAGLEVTRVRYGLDVLNGFDGHDVLLLDLGLPDLDGLEVLRKLRRIADLPVVILTARNDDGSIVLGLRAGADDYLVKPVGRAVLLARIEAVMRRVRPAPGETSAVLDLGHLRVELDRRRVTVDGAELALTNTEFVLLVALACRAGSAVSRDLLMHEVWGNAYIGTSRSLDVFIAQLRAKLGGAVELSTVRGFGYRLGG